MADLCLTLTEDTLEGCRRQLEGELDRVGMAEVRLDLLKERGEASAAAAGEFSRWSPVPLILTARLARDGGEWRGQEEARVRLLAEALDSGSFAWVDLETGGAPRWDEPAAAAARRRGARILRSFHAFQGLPEGWDVWTEELLREKGQGSADGVKAAVSLGSTAELLSFLRSGRRLARIAEEEGKALVLVGMGALGKPVRILAERLGSSWSYAAPPSGAAAPGQMTPEEMEEPYRFSSLTRDTRIFGIIGNPLGQSRSPFIHNPAFAQEGLDAVYLPFPVESRGGLSDFFSLAEELPIEGFSVTVPYKEAVIPYLDHPDGAVRGVGACNTVYRRKDGWHGTNTDAPGFLSHLRAVFPGLDPGNLRAAVVGAGGAARAVVFALREAGCRPLILNRTREKAEALGREMGCPTAGLDEEGFLRLAGFRELIVQTTSAGMTPLEETDPLAGYPFRGDERIYDIVYKPPETKLMARALSAGCSAVNGLGMLQAQGALQFRCFCAQDQEKTE